MLPFTSQPKSFSSPPLCLSLLCWHRVPIRSYPSHIWSFVFPIKGEIYSVHSYFLYFKPASGGLQMNEGVAVVSARLSGDHLAHLIKHRGFNLVFWCTQKTTFTSAYTTGMRMCAGKHVLGQRSSSLADTCASFQNFFFFLLLAYTIFLPRFSWKLEAADGKAPRLSECTRDGVRAPEPLLARKNKLGPLGVCCTRRGLALIESGISQVRWLLETALNCTSSISSPPFKSCTSSSHCGPASGSLRIRSQEGRAASPTALVIEVGDDI